MTHLGKSGLLGEVREVDGVSTVHVEDVYDTDIDDLWAAVTEPARLGRWIAKVDGDLWLGGLFAASFTSGWEGSGRIEVCDAPRHLLLTMEPGTPDEAQIEAVLTAEAMGTRLVVEERGLPADEAPDHGAGWQAHLEDLRAVLEGREPGPWYDRWTELKPAYRQPRSS
ncbi:SRPBCC family protein [Arthrobacter sp. H5]|uniref:SRPBCC family protein n=1 Tax=Arthrobacter sp. H5 TaxID=1267973 RepID=UPI00048079AC|nr:SRPBCC family protein [Arthrobacter sp. H5]